MATPHGIDILTDILTVEQVATQKTRWLQNKRVGTHYFSIDDDEWNVARLWGLASDLPIVERVPESFPEWDTYGWEEDISLSSLVGHMRRILEADLSYPVILSAEGWIMDGYHRVAKAGLQRVLVKTVQFSVTPTPCRRTVHSK